MKLQADRYVICEIDLCVVVLMMQDKLNIDELFEDMTPDRSPHVEETMVISHSPVGR